MRRQLTTLLNPMIFTLLLASKVWVVGTTFLKTAEVDFLMFFVFVLLFVVIWAFLSPALAWQRVVRHGKRPNTHSVTSHGKRP